MAPSQHAITALLRSCGLQAMRVRPVARVYCDIHRVTTAGGGDVALRIYPAGRADARPDHRPWRAQFVAGCAQALRAYADA
jgi:hypothetical protein